MPGHSLLVEECELKKAPTYKAERFHDAEPQSIAHFTKGISQLTSLATYTNILYPYLVVDWRLLMT